MLDRKIDNFNPNITHVIAPPSIRTKKTLCAAVRSKWIVSADWVRDSVKQKRFIGESKYGFKRDASILAGKSF